MTAPAHHEARTGPPSVDRDTFRALMGSLASGVSVVTTRAPDGEPRGFTCSAVCSVSADPPLLLVGVDSRSGTLRAVLDSRRFAVNILNAGGEADSTLFASRTTGKFARTRWHEGAVTGMPLLSSTVAHAECALHSAVEAGDHTLLLGRIVGGASEQAEQPLAYWRGGYARLLRAEPAASGT